MKRDPDTYRHSELEMLRCCGYAFAQARSGAVGSASPSLTAGGNVHRAIGMALRYLIENGHVDIHEVAYRTVQGGGVEYADAIDVLTRFQEQLGIEFDVDPDAVIFLEDVLWTPIPEVSPNAKYRGTPDLVERVSRPRCRITDWKTHWVPETRAQFDSNDQLRRYALLVGERFPEFTEFHLVKRFIRWSNNYHDEVLDRDDLVRVRERLITEMRVAREREREGDLQPTGGAWCAVCTQTHTCPLVRPYRRIAMQDPLTVETDDVAVRLASDAVALDAACASLKARVKRYLGAEHRTGKVTLAGGEFGFAPVRHRRIGTQQLRELLDKHGLPAPDGLFGVNLDVLDRLLRRVPEQAVAEIEAAIHHWESSECRFRRGATRAPAATTTEQGELL